MLTPALWFAGMLRAGRSRTSLKHTVVDMPEDCAVVKCPEPDLTTGVVDCPLSPSARPTIGAGPATCVCCNK